MAHHQHHSPEYLDQVSRSLQSRPHISTFQVVLEDEALDEPVDEPPDLQKQIFKKATPASTSDRSRRESLLTRGLHTDSESHAEDDNTPTPVPRQSASITSTDSTVSMRSVADFTSDDSLLSHGTRATSPGSPLTVPNLVKLNWHLGADANARLPLVRQASGSLSQSPTSTKPTSTKATPAEIKVEETLGRKRCISFACGRKAAPTSNPAAPEPSTPEQKKAEEPAKRQCTVKFSCPFKASAKSASPKLSPAKPSRRLSPAPSVIYNASPMGSERRLLHRDSDATIKNSTPRSSPRVGAARSTRQRNSSVDADSPRTEAMRFHAFASATEEVEEWLQESTCHRSRLTVTDTLKKENRIRQLAEEAEEEEAQEEADAEDDLYGAESEADVFSDGDLTDEGFQTDDEDGFAESDDDDDDSDYEWWAPQRNPKQGIPTINEPLRPVTSRTHSETSLDSSNGNMSPRSRSPILRHNKKRTKPMAIHTDIPELPDSTDFVCGTLDEDRPLEEAYKKCIKARQEAKHKQHPQDIDPTFPTSDPEIDTDDDDDDDAEEQLDKAEESDQHLFIHGSPENIHDDGRGRKLSDTASPRRLRSPAPVKRTVHRSPPPRTLFTQSPKRRRSPAPTPRKSPPRSPHGSPEMPMQKTTLAIIHPLLADRTHEVAYTASLPRSPHPFIRRTLTAEEPVRKNDDDDDSSSVSSEDETEGELQYKRSAIDIVQGLEQKRLRRRERFYRQYRRKEDKREKRRPCPGKGAQRMRQVGLECAKYRGKRVLSV